MKKNLIIVTVALVFSLVLNGALYFVITQKDSNISSLNQQIDALTNDFESLNATFQEYKNNHSHTNSEYDELVSNYEQLTQTYENYVANHTFSNSQYTTLQNEATDLQNQLNELNQNYQDLLDDYDELLADYELITSPATVFETIDDFEIELNLNKRIYDYTEPLSGNVSIYYTNGTAFQGTFSISMYHEDGGGMASTRFDVNGYGDFIIEAPQSFYYGPGEYTVQIMQLNNLDGYIIIDWEALADTEILVVAT
jgi:archaellum component FlaC